MKPRTIHLSPGRHVIIATAKGFNDAQKTVEVTDNRPQVVTITMLPIEVKIPDSGKVVGGTIRGGTARSPSTLPYYVMAAGGLVVGAGALIHATLFLSAREKLIEANKLAAMNPQAGKDKYDAWEPRFDSRRNLTLALYGVGAATVVTGLVLRLTVFKGKESPAQVSVLPQDGGGMLTIGWTR